LVSVRVVLLHVVGANNVIRAESTGTAARIEFEDSNTTAAGAVSLGSVTDDMQFVAGSAEAMRIDSSGNVGIGTSSPGSKLEVEGNSTDSRVHISNTSSGGTAFDGSGSGLLLTAGAMNSTNKFTPAIQFGSTDGSFTTTNPKVLAAINGVASQSYTTDTAGAMELAFYTTPLNQSTGNDVQERLRIDRDGNVGIGTSNPTELLHLSKESSNGILLERTGGSPSEVSFYNRGNLAIISNNTSGIAFERYE
jgi:hypothetical protein